MSKFRKPSEDEQSNDLEPPVVSTSFGQHTQKWLFGIFSVAMVAISFGLIAEMFRTIFMPIMHEDEFGIALSKKPWTLSGVWVAVAFYAVFRLMRIFKIPTHMWGFCHAVCLWVIIPWMLLMGFSGIQGPEIVQAQYFAVNNIGIRDREAPEHLNGANLTPPDTSIYKGRIYQLDSVKFRNDEEILSKHGWYISGERFVFWQTAVAWGYDPDTIDKYGLDSTFAKKLELFATVGPLVAIEAALRGLEIVFIPVLLMLVAFYLTTKEHFFDQIGSSDLF
jgi:hypothetical protein